VSDDQMACLPGLTGKQTKNFPTETLPVSGHGFMKIAMSCRAGPSNDPEPAVNMPLTLLSVALLRSHAFGNDW